MRNTTKEEIIGRNIILSERFVLDVLSNEYPDEADNLKIFWWAAKVISDSIRAGFSDKFLGKVRASFYSTNRIFKKSSPAEIERLFEIVFYDLELNERTSDIKKKIQEASQAE